MTNFKKKIQPSKSDQILKKILIKSRHLAVGLLTWKNYLPQAAKQKLVEKFLVGTATENRGTSFHIMHIYKRDMPKNSLAFLFLTFLNPLSA